MLHTGVSKDGLKSAPKCIHEASTAAHKTVKTCIKWAYSRGSYTSRNSIRGHPSKYPHMAYTSAVTCTMASQGTTKTCEFMPNAYPRVSHNHSRLAGYAPHTQKTSVGTSACLTLETLSCTSQIRSTQGFCNFATHGDQ